VKSQRPGESGAVGGREGTSAGATPGKRTLVEALQKTMGDAPSGQALAIGEGPKIEGGTLFSADDGSLAATVPPEHTPSPDINDAQYETTMGVKAAIDAKKMVPVEGVNGQTFTATGCAGKQDGKVAFTFDRAFVGEYEYGSAGTVRGAHVVISVALSGCGEHKEVKLVQVLRNITKQDGKMVAADPKNDVRRKRSGWDDDKAKSRGWRVDHLVDQNTPFYTDDRSGTDLFGNHGSSAKPAKLRDTPGDWVAERNVGKEFRTCAVSYADGKGTVLACVEWGYYSDDAGKATFYPAKPVPHAGSLTEVNDAAERWDGIEGNIKANLVK
jgi:hypothetical protein